LKPAPSLPPIRFCRRDAHVLEYHVRGVRAALAHLAVGLADGQARGVALHDER
jgi:hypothetical protein